MYVVGEAFFLSKNYVEYAFVSFLLAGMTVVRRPVNLLYLLRRRGSGWDVYPPRELGISIGTGRGEALSLCPCLCLFLRMCGRNIALCSSSSLGKPAVEGVTLDNSLQLREGSAQ